jgi:uncharacterized protein (DUF983 family)
MLEGTKLYSIIHNKCPKCQKADFFVNNNPYKKGFIKMHDRCPHCNELFNKEIGFYYGAMYVSYGLNIGLGIALFLLMVVVFNAELLTYLFTFFAIVVLLFPIIMRTSRLLYINIFVNYDPSIK